MTVTANPPAGAPGPDRAAQPPPDLVTLTIDDIEVSVPKGTLVIRAAEQIGIAIPRFCDHPLLAPAGACRQCLVEVATPGPDGSLRAMPKPQASCTLEATPGMVVRTQVTSPVAEKAQRGIMELLLINHPLDCPVCDKGGECPLQNQAMANGQADQPVHRDQAHLPQADPDLHPGPARPRALRALPALHPVLQGDRRRPVHRPADARRARSRSARSRPRCSATTPVDGARRARPPSSDETGQPFASYFSGNTVQICPVGALTGAAYRFRARPFDLVSHPGRVRALRVAAARCGSTTGAAR